MQIRWKALTNSTHRRTQLIIAAHNCWTSFCFFLVQNIHFVGIILKILPVTCCVRRFPMLLIPIIQFKWLLFCHIMSNHIPPLPLVLSPSKELGTDGIVSCWGWSMGTFIVHFSFVKKWEVAHWMWTWTKIISITRKLSRSPASNIGVSRSVIEPWRAWNTNGANHVGYEFNPLAQFNNCQIWC